MLERNFLCPFAKKDLLFEILCCVRKMLTTLLNLLVAIYDPILLIRISSVVATDLVSLSTFNSFIGPIGTH